MLGERETLLLAGCLALGVALVTVIVAPPLHLLSLHALSGEGGHAAEVTLLGVNPGEWLIGLATLLLWFATQMLVREAKGSSRRQLRAYVFIQDVDIYLRGNDTYLDITVKFMNSGQTPGYDLQTSFKAEIKPVPTVGTPYTELDTPTSKSIIAPRVMVNVGPNRLNLQQGDLDGLRNGTRMLFIWGRLDYVDAFGAVRYFIFQGTNGQELVNIDNVTGTVNWRGFAMRPSPDGYKAN